MAFVPALEAPAAPSASQLWFVVRGAALVARREGESLTLPSRDEVRDWGLDPGHAHYLGRLDEQDCFALDLGAAEAPAPWALCSLRSLIAALDDARFGVAGRAVQIVQFAEAHRYCGRCGTPTVATAGERCLRCPACDHRAYPRVSPAIIVLVRRGRAALLAHASRFPEGLYSTLAGFVEPGESLEETLEREVLEEVGVRVKAVRYFGSQPWPFPHSLMVGFVAEHASGEIAVDGEEIVDARWFEPEALPLLPPRASIARRLIDAWLAETRGTPSTAPSAQE